MNWLQRSRALQMDGLRRLFSTARVNDEPPSPDPSLKLPPLARAQSLLERLLPRITDRDQAISCLYFVDPDNDATRLPSIAAAIWVILSETGERNYGWFPRVDPRAQIVMETTEFARVASRWPLGTGQTLMSPADGVGVFAVRGNWSQEEFDRLRADMIALMKRVTDEGIA